jgi:putative transposase
MRIIIYQSQQHILQTRSAKPENFEMLNIRDRHLTKHHTEGVKSMVYLLMGIAFIVGPKCIRGMFKIIGRTTMYRRKNLTKLGSKEYMMPYLLKDLRITHAN